MWPALLRFDTADTRVTEMSAEECGSRLTTETWRFTDRCLEVVRAGPRESAPPVVFVHGVCHDAWCWHHFLRFFADRGHDTVAVSLRGHGASSGHDRLHELGLADYVDDVARVVGKLGRRPLLVGHSMGGAIVQRYLAEYADTVRGAVLFASATAGGLGRSRFADAMRGNRPRAVFNAIRIAVGRPGRSNVNNTPFFSNRLSLEEAEAYRAHLGAESRRAIRDLLHRFEHVPPNLPPVLVIGSRDDALFGERSQRTTARAYGVSPVLLDGLCHDMMLDPQWRSAATYVLEFLQANANSSQPPGQTAAAAPERHSE
ncbi:alpha/beta fold hydrolase [Mycolicibacterium sp. XJ662]